MESAGAKLIGLKTGDEYEYPIYYDIKYSVERIENVMVDNETKIYEDVQYVPDCILSTGDLGIQVEFHGGLYDKWREWGSITVYLKQK